MNNKKYALTKTEYGIYFDFANNPKSTAYNIPQFLTFDKDTNVFKMKEAVEKAVEAHPYLRTRLSIDENGNVYKSICDEPVNVEIKEIRDAEFNKSDYVYPFDLLKDCLCRFCIFRTESSVVLFCDIHHIIFDGFSLQLFMADIDRSLSGQPLEVETYTGNDVSEEEAQRLLTPELDEAKNYYNSVFGGLELESVPINDKKDGKPVAKKFRYDFTSFNADDIKNFAHSHGIKSSTFFTGVFGLVLAKFSGAEESLFSTIYNARNKKLARSCGMFVKTLPVYCNSKKNENIEQYLKEIDVQLDNNRKYDLYSYADICADMQISPKSLFAYQGNAWQSVNFGGKQIIIETIPSPDAKSSLTVEVFRLNGKFFATVEYRSDLYEEESMQMFIRCYEKTVSEFLSKQNLSEVDITDSEQLALVDSFNKTETAFDTSKTVVDLFREQVQANPDNTAVVYLDKRYTYKQVDEISDKISGYISSLGIGKEDVVSILIPRCEYMVIASLGALKSGAAYQPLDPSYPSERLEFMINDANAKLLIADKSLLDRVPNYKGKVLLLDDILTLPECDKLPESPKPEDLFIMLYTSGSTGIPKGCMLEHRNIASFCNWFRNYYKLTSQSKVTAYASYGFDANMMDTYPTLTSGATLHIIDESIRLDLIAIEKYFNENEITHSFMTTQVGRQFALESNCKTLKYLSVGGEKLVPINTDTNFKFINLYGPTECTVCVTSFTVDKNYDRVPIGKALDNIKLYVVDKYGKLLPPCVPGELWISGYSVSRGYLNRPEQNEKVFIKNPFTDEKGYERVYRTGDIVRYLPNGNIDFVGRNDGQVKIRGFRIELSEVEKVIREYDGIKDATVIARKLPSGGQSINAYITANTKIDISKLNEFIANRKPPYMVPASTMQIDVIPLTVNGKVNKKALPEPEIHLEGEIIPPQNEIQQKIFDCVSQVTGSGNFGITTDIFYAGVTSIGAIKLNVLLSKEFNAVIKTSELKENNTVEKLEKFLSTSQQVEKYDILPDYPITQTQNGIFIECSANENTTMYNIPSLFKLSDKVDVDRLKTAVENTINAHPYIKTRLFMNDSGDVRAKRNNSEKPLVELVECDELPETSELVKPFELLGGNLYRAKIYKTNSANYLFLELHHIIGDGTSMAVIIDDINNAYNGKTVENETYTGFDTALDEEKARKTDAYEKAKKYYDSIFGGCDTDFLPIKDKNDTVPSVNSCELECDLSVESVKHFCDENNITLNAFFNGVFGFVLAKYNCKDEAIYTTVYNGRNDSRLSRAVTMLVKTFPVLFNANGEKKIIDLLTETKNQLMNSMSNDLYSFAEISRAYDIKADIMFVFQGDSFVFDTIAGEKAEMQILSLDTAKAPITINVYIKNNKIVFDCEYRSDMYEESTIMGMAQCLSLVSEEFLSKTYLKDVSVLTDESKALIDSFNQTETAFDISKTVVDLFREQAKANPKNTAVVYLDKRYTYKQVDEISDKIGGYISSLGIGKEDVVSILIPRCEYMVIASLGVLKSGAAYQPLDPSYPSERLEFMIKDASAKLLIADKSLLDRVPNYKGKVLLLDDIPTLPECDKLPESPKPEDLFIMLYTSGSTGIPKGCMLEHRNIASFCNWFRNYYNLTSQSKVAAYASYGFDANMMDTYPTLTSGAELHIIDESIRLDLIAIEKYFNENEITHSFMTTQVGRQFALESNCKTLKYLSVGGEKLVPINADTNFKFTNIYGPTECTVCVTAFTVDKNYDRVPIGKALDNTKLYVVDKYGKILPPCVPGELWISGYSVSRGYLNRPEQNEKVFIKNPFTDEKGYERVYRTGDIVRYLPNGNIDFVGRNDGQVKIRGFRIELSEVEKVIREYDGIKDATVIARKLSTGGQSINAYITSDTKIDISKLNEFIASRKPYYMVPESTVQIDKIPLTVNGKVDKRKLLEIKPVAKSENKTDTPSKPLTMLEKKISEIVEKIIGHNEFGISDDLMHAGMNSLSIIKLAVALNKQFGYEANVKNMMKGCSVVSIENDLQEYLLSGSFLKPSQPVQEKKPHKAVYPLSKTQLGVYLDCMKNPYGTLYNIPSILKFSKNINAQKLADSVKKVVLAHPYIFTHITTQNDDVEQVYTENPEFDLTVEKLTESQFAQIKKDFVQPYNLVKAPLFRIKVIETEKNIYLVTDFHHIVFDGGSLNIFMTQLKEVYEGGEIKPEEYTYFDYVENEVNAENGEEYKTAEKFFDDMMKNFESSSEITPDLSGIMENGKCAEAIIPFEMSAFESFCTDNGVTPAQLFLAGTFYAVSRFVNSRNVYLSTISNGRSDMRLTDCFGMFVKTLPIGIEVDDISSLEFVNRTKSVFTGAIENEIYPYAKICAKFGYAPNIMYEYQLGVTDNLTISGNPVEKDYFEVEKTKFKASVCIESHDNQPCVVVRYNDALYSKELMQTLARSILNSTKHIVENSSGKIRNVSMLDDEQITELKGFSSTLLAPVKNEVLHKIFEKQAEKTPDRKAVVACDRTLTYSELNRLANITANELIARGFKKGGKAVVLLSRTSKIFTTIFGILKAGGAFIPTCPNYPKERIESIIEDSEADFVITEGELLNVYDKTTDVDTLLSGSNSETPNVEVSPEDLAYLIYTSGSTGKPKGVILCHKGISNYITYSDANIHVKNVVDNCTAYGSVTTVAFDMSLKETVLSLCNGLTLVFASDEQTVNPVSLARLLKENNVDVFNSTPSRLLQYMELDEFVEAMKNCKVILSGGEKYPDKLLKLLREKTDTKILNTYGPTEITVSSNCKDLTNACEISIGKPLMNYIEHIVDTDGNLIPVGVVGELLISGCGVALGYNKLPQQTEKAFIDYNGERTYRSGDYAKWTKSGDVIILGRTDNQVKLRGLRIELGEIEKCLSNISGIKSAVAMIRKVNKADAICAYYTAETQLDEEYIRNELKKTLTDYMIPTAYVQLDSMPLTPNGKINTKLLPEPVVADKNGGLEPSTQLERKLCDIFAKVLELDKVYADDNFFDIGGSSLTVTRVIILANKADIEISYGDVFANPTPISLAKLLDKDNTNDEFEDLSKFDYTDINNMLMNNNIDSFKNGEMLEIGDVLLTGAAGFLGIHILYELIHRYSGKIYCMLRDKNNNPAENRLNTVFYYYFEESLKEKYSDRVIVLNGDVTDRKSFDKFLNFKIDTVINCAANVKHFSKGTDIEDVNFYGALNVVDFCKHANARLIHVSTMSVGGIFAGKQGAVDHLEETQLYFGQLESSKYTMSKFLAERAILDKVTKGFNAKIMRVGTLAARNTDGEYQINFTTNTFMGRLKSNLIIGKYPYDMIEMPFELSPIDFVAKAILLLARTPKECTVFHPFNNHTLMMGDLYMEMDKMGLHSQPSENEEYEQALENAKQNPEKAKILSSMIAYQNMAHGQKIFVVSKSNKYTMQVLYRMGFRWPVTSADYMKRFIKALKGLGFFDFNE